MLKATMLGFVLVFGVTMAQAADGPCAKDRDAFCNDVKPQGGALAKCMRDNKDKFSAECKAFVDSMKAEMKDLREACHDDVQKFCSGEKPGGGRIIKCMRAHKSELSEGCRAEMDDAKAKLKHGR